MKFLLVFVAGLFTPFIIGFIIISFGLFDVSATEEPGWLESTVAPFIVNRSIAVRAPTLNAPKPTEAILKEGLNHYRANCVICHAAPGIDARELAKGLNPSAPKLDSKITMGRTDGELYQIISHGIRMTGMPAFAPTHNEKELWHMVTFVRHLPNLTASEKHMLMEEQKEEEGHHH